MLTTSDLIPSPSPSFLRTPLFLLGRAGFISYLAGGQKTPARRHTSLYGPYMNESKNLPPPNIIITPRRMRVIIRINASRRFRIFKDPIINLIPCSLS